jgi:DNA-binding FrmR family transcriptional regulator
MIEPYATQAKNSLKKAQGQLATIVKMTEEDRYCMDVIQQVNAVIGILRQANNLTLESHLHTCGKALASKDSATREKFIAEIMRACDISQRKR